MDTDQPSTPATPPTPSPGVFGTRIPATAAFLVAVLLFLLPFAEVKCNGTALASNTGIGIAMGRQWKEIKDKTFFGNDGSNNSENSSSGENDRKKQDPNIYAIAALALGIIGLLIALMLPRSGAQINLFVGILAAAALIAMLFDLRSQTRSENSIKSSDLNLNAGVEVTVDPTIAFYFTVILFLLAALFSWQRSRTKDR